MSTQPPPQKSTAAPSNESLRKLTQEGYAHEFVDNAQEFECSICHLVIRDPKLVVSCGHSFCCTCLDDWISLRKLTQEGYTHDFVDKFDNAQEFECSICHLVIWDPKLVMSCGYSFCCTCLDDWISSRAPMLCCPTDNLEFVMTDVVPDKRLMRTIGSLKVKCDNLGKGCLVVMELRDIDDHLGKCDYRTLSCNLCEDDLVALKLREHRDTMCSRRTIKCVVCDMGMEARFLQSHDSECPMAVVDCLYCTKGEAFIYRKDLRQHQITICPKFLTFCSFALIGCNNQIQRENLNTHHIANTQEHICLLNAAVQYLYEDTGTERINVAMPHELPVDLWENVVTNEEAIKRKQAAEFLSLAKPKEKTPTKVSVGDRIVSLEKANADFKSKIGNVNKENEILKKKVSKLEKDNTNLQKLLKSEIDELKADIAASKTVESPQPIVYPTAGKPSKPLISAGPPPPKNRASPGPPPPPLISSGPPPPRVISPLIRAPPPQRASTPPRHTHPPPPPPNSQISRGPPPPPSLMSVKPKSPPTELKEGQNNYCPCSWVITNCLPKEAFSPPFFTSSGYKMVLGVKKLLRKPANKVGIRCYLVQGPIDEQKTWPWDGPETIIVRNMATREEFPCRKNDGHGLGRPTDEMNEAVFNQAYAFDVNDVNLCVTVQ